MMNVSDLIAVLKNKADKARCQPLNIFVSSTFLDLAAERVAVKTAILGCGCLPRLAENVDMQPGKSVLQQIPYWLRDIHVLVLLVATRYGELSPSKVSWTEQEVRTASEIKTICIFPYFLSPKLPRGIEFDQEKQNRLQEFPWVDDFAAARNESLRHATGDWIFWLDADDRLDEANRQRLRIRLASLHDDAAGYVLKVRSRFDRSSGSATEVDHMRLFRRHPGLRWQYRVHE